MAGHDYLVHMRACMKEVGFTSCQSGPDIWMQPSKKDNGKDNGTDIWEYFLLYTDDCLVVSPRGRGRRFCVMKYTLSLCYKKNQSDHQTFISVES